jgi:hypothetical protein
MACTVYCIARSEAQAIRISNRLLGAGYSSDDISLLYPQPSSAENRTEGGSTKAPECAVIGAVVGALLGGMFGWLAGVGSLAIPGIGPLVAVGPLLATLTGLTVGGALGGLSGTMIGLGMPEHPSQPYEERLQEENILISVHSRDALEAARIRELFREEHADDISTGQETPVHVGPKG